MRAWLCAVALMLAACDDEPAVDSDPGSETDTQSDTAASEPVSWNDDIWPILDANCHPCHDVRDRDFPGFLLTNNRVALDALLNDSPNSAVGFKHYVAQGDPDSSLLLDKLLAEPRYGGDTMPRGRDPLTEREIDMVRWWIEQGAQDN